MKRQIKLLSIAAVMSLMTLSASADPIAVTVTSSANFPVDTWVDTVAFGAGIEMTAGDGSNHSNTNQGQIFEHLFSENDFYDFSVSSITINFAAIGATFGFNYAFASVFSDIVWDELGTALQSVTISAGATGLLASNIGSIMDDSY